MVKLLNKLYNIYFYLESKIAFYPSIITLGGVLFTFIMFYAESFHISKQIVAWVPQLNIKDSDTAQTLLSTIIGGLISLMVFSFSMVMVVLNQASSNFSPRLLPGLISNKNHQYVLGIYLATIIYCILIFISVESTEKQNQLPVFSILVAVLFTVWCLALFIYFIHSISQSIQVNNIVKNIYTAACARLTALLENNNTITTQNMPAMPHSYTTNSIGYFAGLNKRSFARILKDKEGLQLYVLLYKGQFIKPNMAVFKTNIPLSDAEVKQVMSCFTFTDGEIVSENYVLAFKQLTEIAVKAMSPAINDPGTAVLCVDYLTVLIRLRMQLSNTADAEECGPHVLYSSIVAFKPILATMFLELRNYCAHDTVLAIKLIDMLQYLQEQPKKTPEYQQVLQEQLHIFKTDALAKITSEADKQRIAQLTVV